MKNHYLHREVLENENVSLEVQSVSRWNKFRWKSPMSRQTVLDTCMFL
jgi:hypothetical protein